MQKNKNIIITIKIEKTSNTIREICHLNNNSEKSKEEVHLHNHKNERIKLINNSKIIMEEKKILIKEKKENLEKEIPIKKTSMNNSTNKENKLIAEVEVEVKVKRKKKKIANKRNGSRK